jgi:uncharacterized membrane protein YhaH (DUF805 family)
MTDTPMTPPTPYPGAVSPDGLYVWNGQQWTARTTPAVEAAATTGNGLVVTGYLCAFLLPLIGFILGIVAVTRPVKRVAKHGVWIIVLSIVAFITYMVLIFAAIGSTASNVNVHCTSSSDPTNFNTNCSTTYGGGN